jgi:hypothetical protein
MTEKDEAIETCATCHYFVEGPADKNLRRETVCRRYPPLGGLVPAGGGVGTICFFPGVQSTQWCGEWKRSTRIILQ